MISHEWLDDAEGIRKRNELDSIELTPIRERERSVSTINYKRNKSFNDVSDLLEATTGQIKSDTGLPINDVLSGKVTMPINSSKRIVQQDIEILENNKNCVWEYPGWGSYSTQVIKKTDLPVMQVKHQLDVLRSTAIAGNDLLASVLYTTGLVVIVCGQLAPFAMLICVITLYPFRKILQENGTAIPLNGGVYVHMLNSSNKFLATFAASCSLISYSATVTNPLYNWHQLNYCILICEYHIV